MRIAIVLGALCLVSVPVWGQEANNLPPEAAPGVSNTPQTETQKALEKIIIAESELNTYYLILKGQGLGVKMTPAREKMLEDGRDAPDRLSGAYVAAGKNPEVYNGVLSHILSKFYPLKAGAEGAAQVSQAADEAQVRMSALTIGQNARIIEQNDQIIALLKQLVAKR
jgi:hypothetical protein